MKFKNEYQIEITYGLIIGVLTIAWLLIQQYAGIDRLATEMIKYLSLVVISIPVIGISIGLRAKKKSLNGKITFWQACSSGLIMATISGILTGIFLFIFLSISPAITDSYIEYVRTSMTAAGQSSTEVTETIAFLQNQLSPINQALNAIFGSVVTGGIISVIVAAFIKNACQADLKKKV
ncbi:MAG: DUF4199 domain-containing protein [Patescibacteria group bacterium]